MKRVAGVLQAVGRAVLLVACVACGSESEPQAECGDEVPLVSWETFGEGFLTTYCQGCHAADSLDRQKAPETIVFDTEEDALANKAGILAAAASDAPTMPPNGGPGDADRDKLDIWLTCFAE